MVLSLFLLVGLLDTLHYRAALPENNGGEAVYSPEVLSVFDKLVESNGSAAADSRTVVVGTVRTDHDDVLQIGELQPVEAADPASIMNMYLFSSFSHSSVVLYQEYLTDREGGKCRSEKRRGGGY